MNREQEQDWEVGLWFENESNYNRQQNMSLWILYINKKCSPHNVMKKLKQGQKRRAGPLSKKDMWMSFILIDLIINQYLRVKTVNHYHCLKLLKRSEMKTLWKKDLSHRKRASVSPSRQCISHTATNL